MDDEPKDQYGIPRERFEKALASVSEAAKDRINARAINSTTNFMYVLGIPETPADLAMFAKTVAGATVAAALVDGWVVLTPEGLATEDDRRSASEAEMRAMSQDDLEEFLRSVQRPAAQGGYL